ncbi:MAG: CRTAC1 family protein, partial [Planctomycetaceae bacterium]|nr:CRTAC1 family protein [Planctomycetaceae bacterium]
SQVLMLLEMSEQAIPFADRANRLTKLSLQIDVNPSELNMDKIRSIVEQLEFLGRDWEAAGWSQLVLLETGRLPDWAGSTQRRLHRRLMSSETYTTTAKNPAYQLDLSQFPLPEHRMPAPQSLPLQPSIDNDFAVAFHEEATQTGLHFTYHNGASSGDLESMYEMNGGGVAVLDYDGDHWPDLFFTQGGRLPPAPFDPSFGDQLFRNLGGDQIESGNQPANQFFNVSSQAGIQDIGYGQGVTVGDFDNDGFPDLYVGNIGTNQLYRNNGDGTFADVTADSGTTAGGWTSSCVFADLNQDGLPDLYVVTYLGGDDLAKRPCSKRQRLRCAPLDYPAEQDRLYLNLGDGRFRDVTETSGLVAPDGRGLGVVAADFDGSRRLSLFVANDMSANFFFRNETSAPEAIKFQEQGLLNGLAFDDQGASKACMGVAAGDYNGDGRLDLFVTNFYRQFNDFYVQQPDGSFRDLSRKTNLADSSFLMLGWGTQFIDGELDGYPDLILTNGHVHDPLDPQIPYRMPPQYYRNQGNSTFGEIPRMLLGEFFQRDHHGRSLVRIDWNRDGREDVCISHLNDAVALLTNRTEHPGNYLSIRLVGVDSSREAIGSTVRIRSGQQTWARQLTAGDGFHASNERRLVFGLGRQTQVDSVEVTWPSGFRQGFQNLNVNQEWLLIENRPPVQLQVLPGMRATSLK